MLEKIESRVRVFSAISYVFLTHKLFANTHDLFQSDEAGASGKFKYSLLTFIYKLELMSE